jgi:predicted AAA+ superfamily ATPase
MPMIPRTLETTIKRAMRTFPVVLVTGPRQSGKTTLLTERFAGTHRFVSLENPDIRARVVEDPIGFLKEHPPPIILYEIQYTPELLHYIKSAVDAHRQPGQWLLSGSQNFALMQGVSQSLSGRVAILSLLPFSLGESELSNLSPPAAFQQFWQTDHQEPQTLLSGYGDRHLSSRATRA